MAKQIRKLKSAEEFIEQIQGASKRELFPESACPKSSYCASQDLSAVEQSDTYEEARKCAHRIIRAREKTSSDLLKRLQEKGHSLEDSKRVVERFTEVGLVDDTRYAELYIREAQYTNKGWQRIMRELRQRGIDTEYLESPFDEDELKRASAVIVNLDVDTHKNREKVLRRLLTKGFTYNIAKQAISAKRGDMKEEVHTIAALDDVIF